MDSTDTKVALSSIGKKREDRGVESKQKFGPLNLDIKYPDTAILLLRCKENPILLNAATALSKYATKSEDNLRILFDLDIVESVLPLINHEDLFTRRFAAKLLAEMTSIQSVRDFLLESDRYLPHFTKVLINERDTFMQEFSSLIIAELSKEIYGIGRFLEQCPNMNFLCERIQSTDPDVRKNNIEIMYNLIQDPLGVQEIINAEVGIPSGMIITLDIFFFPLIYRLLQEPYPEIQDLALNVIGDLLARNRDEYIQNLFRDTKGLEALFNFLNNDDWRDLHSKALNILGLASDNHKTIELLNSIGGIQRIYKYMIDTTDTKLFADSFDVVVRFADIPIGRKALYSNGFVDHLTDTLQKTVQPDMYRAICYGIGKMVLYGPAADTLSNENVVRNVLNVLKNDNLKWIARNTAMFALNELFNCNANNCENFLKLRGEEYLIWLIKQPYDDVPLEIRSLAVQALIVMAQHSTLRNLVIKDETIDALCAPFEVDCPTMDEVKVLSCQALSMFCIDRIGRDAFLKIHGPSRLHYLLSDLHSIPVRNAAVQLVQSLCADQVLANVFVKTKYLSYMLNNRLSARIITSWDTCIEALFNSHLPAKFAFTGRLSFRDITKDGFYVLRQNVCPFPVLNDIFRFKFCPLEPVYVVNTARSYSSITTNNNNNNNNNINNNNYYYHNNEKDMEEAKNSIINENASKGVFLKDEVLNGWLQLMFGRLQLDPCLCEYIELLKCKLVAMESKDSIINEEPNLVNICTIASRAKMLAEFVARQMSGPDPSGTCVDHQLEVHLREIKESIGTSVIPLGQLRVGSYLERALLFKVLADKICLPTALVRGEYGTAWVEIAIPQIEVPPEDTCFTDYLMKEGPCRDWIVRDISLLEENQLSSRKIFSNVQSLSDIVVPWKLRQSIFPSRLMKPNVIVDLIEKPGRFIPIDGELGKAYRSKKIVCDLTCPSEL